MMPKCGALTYIIYENYSLSLLFLSFMAQNATETTTKLLRTLTKDNGDGEDINVLLATQELEKFAISYGKIHNKANESKILSDKLFGKFRRNDRADLLSSRSWHSNNQAAYHLFGRTVINQSEFYKSCNR